MAGEFGRWVGAFWREVANGEAQWSDLLPVKERKIVSSVVRERDRAISHFALSNLGRDERFVPLLKAARAYAHQLRNADEPGRLIDAHLIGALLTDALTGTTLDGRVRPALSAMLSCKPLLVSPKLVQHAYTVEI